MNHNQQTQSRLPACGGETAGRRYLLDNSLWYINESCLGMAHQTRNPPADIDALKEPVLCSYLVRRASLIRKQKKVSK